MSYRANRTNIKQKNEEFTPREKRVPFENISNHEFKHFQKNKAENAKNDHSHSKHGKSFIECQDKTVKNLIETKRQTARNRGFDISVSHITSLSDKINTLLSLIKKDKVQSKQNRSYIQHSQEEQTKQLQKVDKQEGIPSHRINLRNRCNTQIQHKQQRSWKRQMKVNCENQGPNQDKKSGKNTNESFSVNQIGLLSQKNNPKQNALKMSYLPFQGTRKRQNIQNKKTQQRSYIEELQEVKIEKKCDDRLQNKYIENYSFKHTKQLSQFPKPQAKNISINQLPKPKNSNFKKLSLQKQRNAKINTTSRLIQDQIHRLKSKIQSNENQTKTIHPHPNKQNQLKTTLKKQNTTKLACNLSKQIELQLKIASFKSLFQGKNIQIESKIIHDELKSQLQQTIKDFAEEGSRSRRQYKINEDYSQFINVLTQCQKNWNNYLKNSVLMSKLKEEDFCTAELDLDQRGYLINEDLVSFINRFAGTYYRHRDVSRVFQRIKTDAKETEKVGLSYQGFQRLLTV